MLLPSIVVCMVSSSMLQIQKYVDCELCDRVLND